MRALIAVGLIALALALVVSVANWSEEATTRADIAAQAQIAVAARQADAAMHAADQATQRAAILAGVLPVSLLIVVVGAVLIIVVYIRGRIALAEVEQRYLPAPPRLVPPVPPGVARIARDYNAEPALIDGRWTLLRDGCPIVYLRKLEAKQ